MLKSSLLALSISLALPSLGCAASAGEPPAAASTATTRAPVAVQSHGPVKLFGEALGDVPLTTAQRTQIEQLARDAEARHGGVRAARKDLMLAVADQVQAGSIDRGALQPKLAALTTAMQQAQPGDRAAFERLHAILGPDQRTAFVDAVEARIGARATQMREKRPLEHWAKELGLTEEQKTQIKAALVARRHEGHGREAAHDRAAAKHHGREVMKAFEQDRFVMDEVAPARDPARMVARSTGRLLGIVETALPILTPEQRAIAAREIRARAERVGEDGAGL